MTSWINRTLVLAPRNGTTSHTVSFTAATAGNFLVAFAYGGVTSTTPTGWTLPTGGSSVVNGGLYVWTKTATAGESSFTTTHNGSNYPVEFLIYEFRAGTTLVKAAGSSGAQGDTTGGITGLTGTNFLFGVAGNDAAAGTTAMSASWSSAQATVTKDADAYTAFATTDGFGFSDCYAADSTATTFTPVVSFTNPIAGANEKITFALNVPTSPAFTASASLTGSGTLSATSTPALTSPAAATGSGSLTASVTPRLAVAAGLSGSGTLSATAGSTPTGTVSAALSGDGALTATSTPALTVAALLSGLGVLTADFVTPTYRFFPPSNELVFRIAGRGLLATQSYGISVWRVGGVWQSGQTPSADQVAGADRFYGGGRIHPLTSAERSDLIAAGYGAYITQETP